MPNRTQIVCLHEGNKGRSIDPLFIRALIRKLNPTWLRPWSGNNVIRTVDCGGRLTLITKVPAEIRAAAQAGGSTTVMVWADVDDNTAGPHALKEVFWEECDRAGISRQLFDNVVFAFAEDRIENWIEFLNTGSTDEAREGPRVTDSEAVRAARKLADLCLNRTATPNNVPPSLEWSCRNWRALKARMG